MASPTPAAPTATRQLLDHLLGGQLEEFVRSRRERPMSWRLIARDIYLATRVDVTEQTLRSWFPEPARDEA